MAIITDENMTELEALKEALRLLETGRGKSLDEALGVLDRVQELLSIAYRAVGLVADGARLLIADRCEACGRPTRECACPDCGLSCAVPCSLRCRAGAAS